MNQNNHRPYLGELNDKQEATKLPRLNFYRRSPIMDQTKLNVRCRTGKVSIKEAQLCGRSSSIIIPNDSEIIFQSQKSPKVKSQKSPTVKSHQKLQVTKSQKSKSS